MNFTHPVLLLLLIPLALFVLWSWRVTHRRAALLLKAASLAAILLAFAEPSVLMPQTKTGLVALVDTSGSITDADLKRAGSLVNQLESYRHTNWMQVAPFAGTTRSLEPQELSGGLHFTPTPGDSGLRTNIERALTGSMSEIPSGYIPHLVLISDGNENEGSSVRAIAELQRLHVPVDTIPLAGRSETGLRLQSVSLPREAYAGEQIPIDLAVDSPRAAGATVTISADGQDLGTSNVALQAGTNLVRIHGRINSSGGTSIAGRIAAPGLGDAPFEQAIQLKKARALYLSQDPAGTDANLTAALSQADFKLSRDASLLAGDLSNIQLIILNNMDLAAFPPAEKDRLEQYVRNGGGLLLIGGERQVYKDDKQLDALDRALPAKLAPPKTPEGTAVALIMDKSSSMEGRKIELARLSAIGVVDHLRPSDTIGILIFDNSFQWAVPMRRAEDKAIIKRLISGITPDGGTQIAPALAEAYRKVLPSKSTYKHMVLLTDGISEEGDSIDLAKEALAHQVTISTVGLGQDVNRSYLEKVSTSSGGRSYFLNDPAGLEQILLKDVEDYSGTTTVEKPLKPIVDHKAEILDGVDIANAPALKGYTRYTAKPSADLVLQIDPAKKDPLYVRWQYGLGRAGVFSSDAKSRWAADWVTWPGFDKFWINVTRDLLAHGDRSEAVARFDQADDEIVVTYRLGVGATEPQSVPSVYVVGPNGFQKTIDVKRSAPGVYEGRLPIGQSKGLFRIRPLAESALFPEVALFRQTQEAADYGSNEALLSQISNLTGGRFNPSPASVFADNSRSIYTTWQLWPAMLGLAILLNIIELITRKWSGLKTLVTRQS